MLSYLKKFNNLPAELREKVSNEEAMAAMEKLEQKYQLPLAALIMKVMVKEITLADLASALLKENLTATVAEQLAGELKGKIFFSLGNYLLFQTPAVAPAPGAGRSGAQTSVKGASFFFSPDDEREIRELTEKIGSAEKIELPTEKIEEKLAAILNGAQINFGSADLIDRFRQILKTYLRGIRNKLETESTLIKPFLSGGLSFDADSARKVMVIVDKILNSKPGESIKSPEKIKIPELEKSAGSKPIVERDAPYDFSKLAKAKKAISSVGSRPEDVSHELAPLTPVTVPVKPKSAVAEAQAKKPLPPRAENKVAAPKPEPDSQMPLIRRRFEAENLNQNQKTRVEDVKYVPRVMSPLDELKYLDLVNFRRLSQNPSMAVEKIKGKLSLLEEENYGKRLEGIRLWRSSPINRMYLEIGHLSIGENKPVDVIIKERKMKLGDYLTVAEFEAIMDLNKSLRF